MQPFFNNLKAIIFFSQKFHDIRVIERFIPHIEYIGKNEKKRTVFRFQYLEPSSINIL